MYQKSLFAFQDCNFLEPNQEPEDKSNYFKIDYNGDTYRIRVREDIAVAFQHEIDHLDGILFVDKIDKKNPFKDKELMREI